MKNAIETPLTTVAVPPCPEWCQEPAGHDYDSIDPTTGTIERHHSWDTPDVGDHAERQRNAWASISACETSLDGAVTLHAPYILVSADGEVTAVQARQYAAELLLAADELEMIVLGSEDTEGWPDDLLHEFSKGFLWRLGMMVQLEKDRRAKVDAIFAARDGGQARRDQRCEVSATTVQTVVPPCPSWCMFEAGHPYKDVVEDVEQVRFHCSEDIHDWAQITAHETMIDGVVTLGPPYINVYADAEELNREQAGEVIEALHVARRKLDEINGS